MIYAEPKPKEEAPDFSKFMNEDLSSLLTVISSSNMQGHECHNNSAREVSNVQSSGSGMTDDNFGLDIKPIACFLSPTPQTMMKTKDATLGTINLVSAKVDPD